MRDDCRISGITDCSQLHAGRQPNILAYHQQVIGGNYPIDAGRTMLTKSPVIDRKAPEAPPCPFCDGLRPLRASHWLQHDNACYLLAFRVASSARNFAASSRLPSES